MILGVSHIELVADKACSLWTIEFGDLERSVSSPIAAAADNCLQFPGHRCYNNAIVIAVRDEESLTGRICEDLARITQRSRLDFAGFRLKDNRRLIQRTFPAVILNQLSDDVIKQLTIAFTTL